MSDTLDPQLIEQTKRQIRSLVNEIAQLVKSDIRPDEFYSEFLPRVVSALAAEGGVIWAMEEQGRLGVAYQMGLQKTRLAEREENQKRHSRLLNKVLNLPSGDGLLVPPHSGSGDDEEAANPTDFLLVMAALKTDIDTIGIVEIFQRPESPAETQKGYLRFLLQMCELAGDFFKSRQIKHFADRQVLWTQLEEFARMVHANLDPRETAYTIANEGRRLIECDRVSVAIRKGKKCYIEAVSGQDMFDKRSNTIRLLGRLATAVVASGETMWYTGDTTNMAPQVEDAVQEYVDESHSKTVAVLPLARPRSDPEEEEASKREDPEAPIGALIVEEIEDSRVPDKMLQRVDVVGRHSATALANALDHDNLFLMPLWRTVGRQKWVLKARTLPKTLAISGAVLAVLVLLGTFPYAFTLRAKGTIEPVDRRIVFAPSDAEVELVEVKHGDTVRKGDLLAKLRDTESQVKLTEIQGQIDVSQRTIESLQYQSRLRGISKEERNRILSQEAEENVKLLGLQAQAELLQEKIKDLNVLSPIDGQVITWDVQNHLKHRPVQRGQELMRIADPKGDWQLELDIPEKRMGHIARAQREIKEELDVDYALAIDPSTTRTGHITKIEHGANPQQEEGNMVKAYVWIDTAKLRKELPENAIRPGAAADAKINCGRRAIGYVWFHDAIEYLQSRVIFPYF
jgi:multidrug efflux pump subunit AcrA (membrane-fusion protein)